MQRPSISKLIPALVTGAIVITTGCFYWLHDGFHHFANEGWQVLTSNDEKRIESWISELSYWGPIIIISGFIIQMFAFVIPSWLLMVVSILAYGPFRGSLLAIIGVLVASCLAYGIGSYLSEYTLKKLIGKSSEAKMKRYLDRYGFWLIAIFRLAPFLSNDTISFVAGLTAFRFKKFIAATTFGIVPLIALIAFLGQSTDRLKTGMIWVSAACLVGFGIYTWWDQRKAPQ